MISLLIAGTVAFVMSLAGTRVLMTFFRQRGQTQPILAPDELNVIAPEHQHKSGTPTMGGLAIMGAAALGYLVPHVRRGLVFSDQAMLLFLGVLVMATLGFIDDFIKVTVRRNRGVFWKKKGVITLGLAGVVATLFTIVTDVDTRIGFTRADLPGWQVPTVVWIVFAALVIFATTNAVNVTDGLDGLAAGSSIFGFVAFGAIAYWGFRNPELYESLVNPLDLAVAAVAFAGACAGFLWWNAAPARVFMGDVGALGLGAALSLLALTTNTVLLLPLIGGIFVMEIGSVAVQMTVFRLSGRKKRLFRMSPIHHHFELGGWPETTVIVRFWLISGICVAAAMALYIADFTRNANP